MKNRITTTFETFFGKIEIGDDLPCALIAEIGLNHNGSEILAMKMIEAAAYAGATFVKFQKRDPSALATKDFLDSPFAKCPALGTNQRIVRERLELDLDVFVRLREYAESLGLIFFSSAFDIPSLNFLIEAGVGIIKIASHSLTNQPLINEVKNTCLPVILSLGGSTEKEQEKVIDILRVNPLVLMHCVSSYPTADNIAKLDTINVLKEKYSLPVGFSSHERGIDLSIAASTLGASLIERHFTINRSMVGLDQSISLEPSEFSKMSKIIKRVFSARGVQIGMQELEKNVKNAYHVSVCSSRDLKKGEFLNSNDVVCKQPLKDANEYFTGLELDKVIGRKLNTDILSDKPIARSYIE